MSIKDGEDTHWSSNSCEGSDLEEYEARLYSMVYHNSSTYDEPTTRGKSPQADLTSTTVDNDNANLAESVPSRVINVESPNNVSERFHHCSRNKASRLNRVNEIIGVANNIPNDRKGREMYSKRGADVPKTASVYFQNLTKSLDNVQYLRAVETRLSEPSRVGAGFASGTPVFRPDDRPFPDAPQNTSTEESELSRRLFANRPGDSGRHNHRFGQLPTVPIVGTPAPTKKARRKKRGKARHVAVSPPPPPPERLDSVLAQRRDLDDELVVLLERTEADRKETVINLVDEVINLDSDSDSADSIVVITPPCRTPPPVIALSDEEGSGSVTALVAALPPPPPRAPPETAEENSFDFLEGSDDPDGILSRSQVSVFTHLMSNSGGSKESLLDDRLFLKLNGGGDLALGAGTPQHAVQPPRVPDKPPTPDTVAPKQPPKMAAVVDVVDSSSGSPGKDSRKNVSVRISSSAKTTTLILNVRGDSEGESSPVESGKRKRGPEEGERKVARKKRGKKAREKSRHQLQEFLQTRSGMASLLYTHIEGDYSMDARELRPRHPTKWTRDMRRHYTDSWGGEAFDVQTVQQTMSVDQSMWRISWEDRRGPVPLQGPYRRSRCYNCNRFGHPANTCPEPHRISKCHMCGEPGHREPTCPNKICLQCGRPTPKFSAGCWECQHVPHPLCTRCVWKHNPATPCMDVGRSPVRDLRSHLDQRRRTRFGDRSLDAGRPVWDTFPPPGHRKHANPSPAPFRRQRNAHRRSRP